MIIGENNSIISVIVPVYNVEKYLHKCIESILSQTYHNIEIVLVDDGSTDNSGIICDEYATVDNRIRVLHEKNRGVSAARNLGIAQANGSYLLFVDSDDYIDKNMCENLLKVALSLDADIVFSDFYYDEGNKIVTCSKNNSEEITAGGLEQIFAQVTNIDNKSGINVCSKLFKSEIVKKHRFREGTPLGEDQLFVFTCLFDCSIICKVNNAYYHYVIRAGSAMRQDLNLNNERKLVVIYNDIQKKIEEQFTSKIKNRFIAFRITQCELTIINKMLFSKAVDKTMLDELREYIRKNIKSVLLASFPAWKKLQIVLCAYTFLFYKKIIETREDVLS